MTRPQTARGRYLHPAGDRLRHAIYDTVAAAPGLNTRALALRLGIDYRTALWHMARLDRCGLLLCEDDAGRLYVFRATGAERHRDQF